MHIHLEHYTLLKPTHLKAGISGTFYPFTGIFADARGLFVVSLVRHGENAHGTQASMRATLHVIGSLSRKAARPDFSICTFVDADSRFFQR